MSCPKAIRALSGNRGNICCACTEKCHRTTCSLACEFHLGELFRLFSPFCRCRMMIIVQILQGQQNEQIQKQDSLVNNPQSIDNPRLHCRYLERSQAALLARLIAFDPRNQCLGSIPAIRPFHGGLNPRCNERMKTETETLLDVPSLNVLLSNGRFPVAIDLARQLKQAGHTIFVVDPMHYHACKASNVVTKSVIVPAPSDNAPGYIAAVKSTIKTKQIDLIIPLHEEIFHLAECEDRDILDRLFAPLFGALVRLHDKWQMNRLLKRIGLDYPQAFLCRSMDDVRMLDLTREWALKPVFGRASGNVFHLKPDEPLPSADELAITEEVHYTAQEWLYGSRYCSYSIVRDGKLRALAIYPVKDTLDDSSCVYFESIEHAGIREYVEKIVASHPGLTGQLAFDFVETADDRLVAIECNPRATSGIHLFAGTPDLARCITDPAMGKNGPIVFPRKGAHRQFLPGMMLVPWRSHGSFSEYFSHVKRFWTSRDVIFSLGDILPLPTVLMQPIFLSCLGFCQGKDGMSAPDMFQEDLLWVPVGKHLERVKKMLKEMAESDEEGLPPDGNLPDAVIASSELDGKVEFARRCSV